MYKYLGNTDILMYDVFNNISIIALVFMNFLHCKQKTDMLGRLSSNIYNSLDKRHKSPHAKTVLAMVEIALFCIAQYLLGGAFNRTLGNLVGTGGNYFAMLFLSPICISAFCFFLGTDIFKQIDMVTPAYPFTLIFVRIACLCAGCCNGMESTFGIFNHDTERIEIPIQLFESIFALAIFIFLILYRKKAKEGTLFPIYMITYSAGKFVLELFGAEEKVFLVFNPYHILAVISILLGVLYLFVIEKYKSRIRQFASDYFDAAEDLYDDVAGKINPKRNRTIVHRSNKKKKRNLPPPKSRNIEKTTNMKRWILIWSLGLMGQTGWNIESTWFSTYIYEKIDKTPTYLTPMLFLGAFANTAAVMIFGTVSDRTGKRRTMISSGFIIWGILNVCFSATKLLPEINLSVAGVVIIIIDMFISFFAAVSVSVGFNTWITDIMNEKNIGQIGAAIAAQTVLGSLLANVVGGALIGSSNNYTRLFIVTGVILVLVGWLSTFLFDSKDDTRPSVRGSFTKQFFELLDFKSVFKQKELVWVNVTITLFFIGFSCYFPHLGNYLTQYLGYTADKVGLIEALPLVSAMFVTIPASKLINKNKFVTVTLLSIIIGLIGTLSLRTLSPETVDVSKAFNLRLFATIFLVGISYIIIIQATKTWSKNLYPKDSKGQYESLWAISYALIPMFFGSNLSEWIIRNEGVTRFNEMTQRYEYLPDHKLFIIGSLISCLSIIPIIISKFYLNKKEKAEAAEKQ